MNTPHISPARPTRQRADHVWRLSDVLVSDGVARPRQSETAHRYDHDDRLSRDLEMAASQLIRSAGDLHVWHLSPAGSESLHHVDVIDRWTRRPFVAGDRMAFRGVARWQPVSVRYRSKGTETTREPRFTVAADGTCTAPYVLTEHRTDAAGRGYGWIGHRRITVASRARTTGVKRARGGQPVGAWSLAEASVRRRWAKATADQRDMAANLERVLTMTGQAIVNGATVTVLPVPSQRVIVQVSGAGTPDRVAEASFGLVDYCRRAALA